MKASTFTAVFVSTAISLAAGAAVAKPGNRSDHTMFDRFDLNGDGLITREEADAARDTRFSEIDTNADGLVSRDELTAQSVKRAEERVARMMERLDADGDGLLSKEDMAKGSRIDRMFDRLDADNDGVITQAEFDDARKKIGQRRGHKSRSE